MARRAIEAHRASERRPHQRVEIAVPTIKGRITERLSQTPPRVEPNEEELAFRDEGPEVVLRSGDERGAVALACLILENLQRHGGTRAPSKALKGVLDRALKSLTQREVMEVEIEAYELLLWLGRAVNPALEGERADDGEAGTQGRAIPYDPEASVVQMIERAIGEGFDLEMTYYTGGRGELTERRITPHSVEAETYLSAFCHKRQDDRVFRISRISTLRPVGGLAVAGWDGQHEPPEALYGAQGRGSGDAR